MSLMTAASSGRSNGRTSTAAKVFLAALSVRSVYALLLYSFMGDGGLEGVDSTTYASQGQSFAEAILAGSVSGSHWLGSNPSTMPLFQWLTALPFLAFGKAGTIAYVLMQDAFDAGTCVLVYCMARSLDERMALPAAVCAILNPTQIVLSGLIYTDTPFTFFVTLSIWLAVRWIRRPTMMTAIFLGCSLGAAALVRVSIAPWAFAAIAMLAIYSFWLRRPLRQASVLAATLVIVCASLAMISVRSFDQYGTFALTPQGGPHLAIWIVPLSKEAQDRTPFDQTMDTIVRRTEELYGSPSADPFEQSRRYQRVGWEALRDEIAWTSLVKSWAVGAFINLASPAHLLSPPVSQLPRTGFYATPGSSFVDKVLNYAFRSGNILYSWLLILGTLGLVAVRAVQIIGFCHLVKRREYWPALLFAGSWIVFLLLLNGPVASPKYRLPLEPLFDILAGAGILAIWINRRSHSRSSALRSGNT